MHDWGNMCCEWSVLRYFCLILGNWGVYCRKGDVSPNAKLACFDLVTLCSVLGLIANRKVSYESMPMWDPACLVDDLTRN